MASVSDLQPRASTSNDPSSAPYILIDLLSDIPLSTDLSEDTGPIYITCVDVYETNLYVGTSAGELLHFVSIPADPQQDGVTDQPTYVLASRLQPPFGTEQQGQDRGVKQILLLPNVEKACVLCNGTLTFYSLPELTPAYGGRIKQGGCTWVGGLDSNEEGGGNGGGTVIVICLKQRLRLIRIGDDARKIRDIELGSVQAIQRRGDLACVANGTSYSLLDVVNQQKVDLFPITTISTTPPETPKEEKPLPSLPPPQPESRSRSFSAVSPVRGRQLHARNISLGGNPQDNSLLRPDSSSPWPARSSSRQFGQTQAPSPSPGPPTIREDSPAVANESTAGQAPSAPILLEPPAKDPVQPPKPLLANVVSPTETEFLLTTGTKLDEPGVGMFVNLEGDLVPRGTIEFSSYPLALVLDGSGTSGAGVGASQGSDEGHVLALVQTRSIGKSGAGIEIQRWDLDPGEAHAPKELIQLAFEEDASSADVIASVGLRSSTSVINLSMPKISESLRLRRLKLRLRGDDLSEANESDLKRRQEEDRLVASFAQVEARILAYVENKITWVVRNSLIVQLERQLALTVSTSASGTLSIDVPSLQRIINSIRGQEPRNELEFLTLTYVRQKASILMFGDLLLHAANGVMAFERNKRAAEEALLLGELDPRVILGLVPPFDKEVVINERKGIWVPQGLCEAINTIRSSFSVDNVTQDPDGAYGDNLLKVLKRYLLDWRKKKDFASVSDKEEVFQTVDAALIHVLLLLDRNSPRGPAIPGSTRAELNETIRQGIDCFDRVVELFEENQRLYMLSRLYQSRKNVGMVLATWRRIIDGERDAGGELIEGEHDMRRYLPKLKNAELVKEYGAWLANRNPKLGVQVFADDSSTVKFKPAEAVAILKEKAPGAVKDYLEHLVFGKHHVQYVNDLIAFYLDTVLAELEESQQAKDILLQSYETYRALRPPKPTYSQFITDNAIDAEWWQNRLRLLQLIGGSHGAASKYDVHTLGERLAPYSDELVPEMIILNGRLRNHKEALRLLTHGLGDYDTAVRYCLLGGSSIFHSSSSFQASPLDQQIPTLCTKEEQAHLFEALLNQFFKIEDLSERLERTAELLERFGGWFDVANVLELIPESWSVELVSGFLVHAFRRLVKERNESAIVKALIGAQNLRESVGFAEKIEKMGPVIVRDGQDDGENENTISG
ncbi:hypothetical protein K431DRAFT_214143 [Polychaeton citri CBS 116435]|uniref:CNH domain-containing protein n=1 Tax=Polychaeton citri CBS 116435 TaxID=1314669 RepID=A0A9P4UTQ8_9PEZI|nr:hypothetical protein K431DRAFT_214143 [Polychaeton citri CBS 116435]